MFFVYVIQSLLDKQFYTGYTDNFERRIIEHNSGKVKSTKNRRPFELVYYEVSFNKADALHREKYLKTSYGKRYIKNRIKYFLESFI